MSGLVVPEAASTAAASDSDAAIAQMQQRFEAVSERLVGRMNELSSKLDELDKSISIALQQAGQEVAYNADVSMHSRSPVKVFGRSLTSRDSAVSLSMITGS